MAPGQWRVVAGGLGLPSYMGHADVAHSDDARRIPDTRGAGDVAGFFAVRRRQRRSSIFTFPFSLGPLRVCLPGHPVVEVEK